MRTRLRARILRGPCRRDEGGQAIFEWVLVFPYVLILIFLLFELTVAGHTWMRLEHASRQGARYAAVGQSSSAVQSYTTGHLSGLTGAAVLVTNAQGAPCTPVQVEVTYTYTARTPFASLLSGVLGISAPNLNMRANTQMMLEGLGTCPAI